MHVLKLCNRNQILKNHFIGFNRLHIEHSVRNKPFTSLFFRLKEQLVT